MIILKRSMYAVIAFSVLFAGLLSGCSAETTGKTFWYDMHEGVSTLDPQYATSAAARMIIHNIYEGLIVKKADGSLVTGAAKSYEISRDGLVYTFALRQDAMWAKGENVGVTAADFVFAFHRMFNSDAVSPYAKDYLCIKNAESVMNGLLPAYNLGVKAVDKYTLEIELEKPSPFFLERLADSAAMPCSRTVYEEARGRYGLELKYTDSNGPFFVDSWNGRQIALVKSESYISETETAAGKIVLNIGRDEKQKRFEDGMTDIAQVSFETAEKAKKNRQNVEEFEETTWCIVFNQNTEAGANPLLRQGFASAVNYTLFNENLAEMFEASSVLVPPAMKFGSVPFREIADKSSVIGYDAENAKRLFELGLNMLGYKAFPDTNLFVPDTGEHAFNMGFVQQSWQKNLSVFVNIQPVSAEEIENRYASGEYQIMLMPFSPADPRVETLLNTFTGSSRQNHFGYSDPRYDSLLAEAAGQDTIEAAAAKLAQAERMLLADAVIIPLYTETCFYAMGENVSGLEIQPFGNNIYFKYAEK